MIHKAKVCELLAFVLMVRAPMLLSQTVPTDSAAVAAATADSLVAIGTASAKAGR